MLRIGAHEQQVAIKAERGLPLFFVRSGIGAITTCSKRQPTI